MLDHEVFSERIRAYPDDDGPRLIYADWLDERGDPRGEFIRVQCALAALSPDDPRRFDLQDRERRLLLRHADEWVAPLRGLGTAPIFRRGFVEIVNVEARRFLARGADLFARTPIRQLRLLDVGSSLDKLMKCPLLGRLSGLTLFAQHLGIRLARALADCPHVSGLESLDVGRNQLTDQGVELIVHSPLLVGLRRLDLSDNLLSDLSAQSLATSPVLRHLQQLRLHRNEMTFRGLEALAASTQLPALIDLGLSHNQLHTLRLHSSYQSPGAPRLLGLDVRSNMLGAPVLEMMLNSPHLVGLHRLDLGHNPLHDQGGVMVCRSATLAKIRAIWLNDTRIGDTVVRELAESPHFIRLRALDLMRNPRISDVGAAILLDGRYFPALRRLAPPTPSVSARLRRMLQARFGGVPYRLTDRLMTPIT